MTDTYPEISPVQTIDTRPQICNIHCYAGDTYTMLVKVESGWVQGRTWLAAVRTTRVSFDIDAYFQIMDVSADSAYLVLTAEDTQRLAENSPLLSGRRLREQAPDLYETGYTQVRRYTGEWDCQVYDTPEAFAVQTLVQGGLTIDLDVSRSTAVRALARHRV